MTKFLNNGPNYTPCQICPAMLIAILYTDELTIQGSSIVKKFTSLLLFRLVSKACHLIHNCLDSLCMHVVSQDKQLTGKSPHNLIEIMFINWATFYGIEFNKAIHDQPCQVVNKSFAIHTAAYSIVKIN